MRAPLIGGWLPTRYPPHGYQITRVDLDRGRAVVAGGQKALEARAERGQFPGVERIRAE
jgi:hypothetical protein